MSPCELVRYLEAWNLVAEDEPYETPTSWLLPVRSNARAAMLKLLKPESDEGRGAALLRYWAGQGAVRLFAVEGPALLMERAEGGHSLVEMAISGGDLEAAGILAETVRALHEPRDGEPPAGLTPLSKHFMPLLEAEGTLMRDCAEVAHGLLVEPRDEGPLHGDMHHENVLDAGERGWLAIDPKGLWGERTYEVANLLRNPIPHAALVQNPERMLRLARFYGERLGFDPDRVLAFALAHAGLSAVWSLESGRDPSFSLACARVLAPLVPRGATQTDDSHPFG